jgi:putative membrane protein
MRAARHWILLSAGALMVASSVAAQTRTTGSGIPVSKDRDVTVGTTPGTGTTITSGGSVTLMPAFDIAAYANMSEKNITAHMATADSLEIQLGQLAQSKGTAQSVRDFGAMLTTDHTAHLAKTQEIITDEKVGAEAPAMDPEAARLRNLLTRLTNMPAGSAWDAQFLRAQAEHHQHEIDILNANVKNAHDDDLEDHVKKSLTSLAKHRDSAKSVATTLGVSIP